MIDKDFLRKVWERQPKGTHIFLCKKSNLGKVTKTKTGNLNIEGKWSEHKFKTIDQAIDWLGRQPQNVELYWCPTWFNGNNRTKDNVVGSSFLWADLDQANPKKFDKSLRPSIAWESSPGRFQGLWELKEQATPKEIEEANRAIAYALSDKGADRGGWDLSQVLRIPGATNNKYKEEYEEPPISKLLWFKDKPQSLKTIQLAANVKTTKTGDTDNIREEKEEREVEAGFAEVLSKHRKKLGAKIIGLLLQEEAEEGRRSDVLWYLEHELIKKGLSVQEVIALVRGSVWNKYEGRRDEVERLTHEISRALEDEVLDNPYKKPDKETKKRVREEVSDEYVEPVKSFNIVHDTSLMASMNSQPGWLVKGFWTKESHGIVAGQPKSFKSTLITDLVISVASGRPFLGCFPVDQTGPVLVIQNENADWIMKDRLTKIRVAKELCGTATLKDDVLKVRFPQELPIHYVNNQGFNLSNEDHRALLIEMIEELKPVLVVLDPLYLMFHGDLNSAKELNPVLSWLLQLKIKYKTSLIVIHHYNKGGTDKRAGQRMLGSATLHGWTESAWYLETQTLEEPPSDDQEPADERPDFTKATGKAKVTIEREFRGAGMHPKIDLEIQMGETGDTLYAITVDKHKPVEPVKKKRGKSADESSLPKPGVLKKQMMDQLMLTNKPLSLRKLHEGLGISRRQCEGILIELLEDGVVRESGSGYELVS